MAMIKCAECGKEFSDRANACPNCGCPIEYQAEKSIAENTTPQINSLRP